MPLASRYYQLVLQPRARLLGPRLEACLRGFTSLANFVPSDGPTDASDTSEYRLLEPGRSDSRCEFSVSYFGLVLRTTEPDVSSEEWEQWRDQFLEAVVTSTDWSGRDMLVFAAVRRYFLPREGNNYDWLRATLLSGSPLHSVIPDTELLELTLDVRSRFPGRVEMELQVRLSSDQSASDILAGTYRDDDSILLEAHVVRRDIRSHESLQELATDQEVALERWMVESRLVDSMQEAAT